MENFFDVATPEELREWYEEELTEEEIAENRKLNEQFPDSNYADLFNLYLYRGNKEMANYYLDKIEDKKYKRSIYFNSLPLI